MRLVENRGLMRLSTSMIHTLFYQDKRIIKADGERLFRIQKDHYTWN